MVHCANIWPRHMAAFVQEVRLKYASTLKLMRLTAEGGTSGALPMDDSELIKLYVVGVLDAPQREGFEARMRDDALLRTQLKEIRAMNEAMNAALGEHFKPQAVTMPTMAIPMQRSTVAAQELEKLARRRIAYQFETDEA